MTEIENRYNIAHNESKKWLENNKHLITDDVIKNVANLVNSEFITIRESLKRLNINRNLFYYATTIEQQKFIKESKKSIFFRYSKDYRAKLVEAKNKVKNYILNNSLSFDDLQIHTKLLDNICIELQQDFTSLKYKPC